MYFMTSIDQTAITIDPLILAECVNIWWASKSALPPSPYEIMDMDSARLEVVTMANIMKYYEDEPKRKAAGFL